MSIEKNKILKREIMTAVIERLKYRTGIFISDNGLNQFSGTFLTSDDKYYVLTANHCLTYIRDMNTIYVSTFKNQEPGLHLNPSQVYRLFPHDLAVLELDGALAQELNVSWINRSDVSSELVEPGAIVCLVGFPSRMQIAESGSPSVIHPYGFVYFSELTYRETSLLNHVNHATDILIEYDQQHTLSIEDDTKLSAIEPEGMSGCGVFLVPRPAEGSLWNPNSIRLVGIYTDFYRQQNY